MTKKSSYLSTSVLALLLTIFVDAAGWGLIFPSLTPLLIQNTSGIFPSGFSIASRNLTFEWIVALYSLFMLIGAPLLGSLSDQWGRKPVLRLCLVGSTVSYLFAAVGVVMNNLSLIILSRIIGGLTAGSMPIAQSALLDMSMGTDQKARRLSWVTLASNLGFACGPVLGALVLGERTSLLAYSLPFWLGALLAIAGVLLIVLGFKETLIRPEKSVRQPFHFAQCFSEFSLIIKDRLNRHAWLLLILSLIAYSGFMAMLPIYFSHYHYSGRVLGYSMAWFALFNSLSLIFLIPRLIPRLRLKTLTLIGLGGALTGNVLFALSGHLPYLLAIITLVALASPFSYIGLITLIANNASAGAQGKVMGLAGSLMALSWIIAPLLAGLSTRYNYQLIYEIHALLLAGCLSYVALKKTRD